MTDADVTEPASQHSDAEAPVPYRSGFVVVVGRPNVGKSTLINALIGTQIAIASSRPETTRKAIRGILTTDNAQIVLVDTPGIHRPRTLLGQRLNDVVDESLSDVDAIAFLLPAMGKEQLFPTVIRDGVLPRKTFSMGEAHDKRFYLEARKIR